MKKRWCNFCNRKTKQITTAHYIWELPKGWEYIEVGSPPIWAIEPGWERVPLEKVKVKIKLPN